MIWKNSSVVCTVFQILVKIQKYKADNIYPLVVKLYTTQNVGYTHETYSTHYIPQPRKLASRHVNMRGGK